MARDARKMSLSAFIAGSGHHPAAWRQPDSDLAGSLDLSYWIEGARTAERGKLDAIFFADVPGSPGHVPGVTDRMPWLNPFEPLTLLSALAVATTRIGLICTSSTTYNEPYNLARQFASLDHISRGRAAWNVVTTQGDAAARNCGQAAAPGHSDRYDRAAEVREVAKGHCASWDDGAFGDDDTAERNVYHAEGR
ncbi:MAG: LLM class flavin-dependent oxidoreductase, partial [Acidimicrobiia bacterium]